MNILLQLVHPAHFHYYRNTIDNLKQKNDLTVLMITHREAVLDQCDRIITVINGTIQEK